jgi:hypothetical protein
MVKCEAKIEVVESFLAEEGGAKLLQGVGQCPRKSSH